MSEAEGNIQGIGVVHKPRASELIRAQVIAQLRSALALAEQGQVSGLVLLLDHPDNTWSESVSGTESFSASIGRMEIVKARWIAEYIAAQAPAGRPLG